MSRFLSKAMTEMSPYVPGEQCCGGIKLNTNECPYPPSPLVSQALSSFRYEDLRLYPNPDPSSIKKAAAEAFDLLPENIFCGGGSDECLAFSFMAFFDPGDLVLFPNITYGFYKIYAELFGIKQQEIPLAEDFTIHAADYFNAVGNVVIANPNAPTGICLDRKSLVEIIEHNRNRLIIIDEAYADFAPGSTCRDLVKSYDNLLVIQTFSKSRALAGMRLSLAFGCAEIINGLEKVKYSFNPYNLDRVSIAVALAAIKDRTYTDEVAKKIAKTREWTTERLKLLGFKVLPSTTNFVFASPPNGNGREIFEKLKKNGILVRHFPKPETSPFVRISIGTDEEMTELIDRLTRICGEEN